MTQVQRKKKARLAFKKNLRKQTASALALATVIGAAGMAPAVHAETSPVSPEISVTVAKEAAEEILDKKDLGAIVAEKIIPVATEEKKITLTEAAATSEAEPSKAVAAATESEAEMTKTQATPRVHQSPEASFNMEELPLAELEAEASEPEAVSMNLMRRSISELGEIRAEDLAGSASSEKQVEEAKKEFQLLIESAKEEIQGFVENILKDRTNEERKPHIDLILKTALENIETSLKQREDELNTSRPLRFITSALKGAKNLQRGLVTKAKSDIFELLGILHNNTENMEDMTDPSSENDSKDSDLTKPSVDQNGAEEKPQTIPGVVSPAEEFPNSPGLTSLEKARDKALEEIDKLINQKLEKLSKSGFDEEVQKQKRQELEDLRAKNQAVVKFLFSFNDPNKFVGTLESFKKALDEIEIPDKVEKTPKSPYEEEKGFGDSLRKPEDTPKPLPQNPTVPENGKEADTEKLPDSLIPQPEDKVSPEVEEKLGKEAEDKSRVGDEKPNRENLIQKSNELISEVKKTLEQIDSLQQLSEDDYSVHQKRRWEFKFEGLTRVGVVVLDENIKGSSSLEALEKSYRDLLGNSIHAKIERDYRQAHSYLNQFPADMKLKRDVLDFFNQKIDYETLWEFSDLTDFYNGFSKQFNAIKSQYEILKEEAEEKAPTEDKKENIPTPPAKEEEKMEEAPLPPAQEEPKTQLPQDTPQADTKPSLDIHVPQDAPQADTKPSLDIHVPQDAPQADTKPSLDIHVPQDAPQADTKPSLDIHVPQDAPQADAKPSLDIHVPRVAPQADAKPTLEIREERLPFQTKIIEDATLPMGTEVEEQKGEKGIVQLGLVDGKEIDRNMVKEPVDHIVRRGTKKIDNPKADMPKDGMSKELPKSHITKQNKQTPADPKTTMPKQDAMRSAKAAGSKTESAKAALPKTGEQSNGYRAVGLLSLIMGILTLFKEKLTAIIKKD